MEIVHPDVCPTIDLPQHLALVCSTHHREPVQRLIRVDSARVAGRLTLIGREQILLNAVVDDKPWLTSREFSDMPFSAFPKRLIGQQGSAY